MKQKLLLLCFLAHSTIAWSADLRGRLGVGFSNQLANEVPAISLKIQQSKTSALGAILGFKTGEDETLYGAGVKFYRIIFDEPQLNFYLAGLFAAQNYIGAENQVESGYQLDGTLGTEFHLQGIESLGFSVEFGLSARKADEQGSSFQTLGDHLLKASVHFYL